MMGRTGFVFELISFIFICMPALKVPEMPTELTG